ncbi:MAG: hypothetical protein AB1465_00310 [Patescibacteria group bacterium]
MNLIVVPPKVNDCIISEKIKAQESYVFLADFPGQMKNFKIRGLNILNKSYFLSQAEIRLVEKKAEFFAQNWFKQGKCQDLLSYRNINIGDACYLLILNYIIKVLRAILISEKLINDNLDKKFFLIDDKGFWSKTFLAVIKNKYIEAETLVNGIKVFKKTINKEGIKSIIKKTILRFTRLNVVNAPNFKKEKIIFSCALRFIKDIWQELSGDYSMYYLRPIFSFDAHRIEKDHRGLYIKHILPEYFISNRDKNEIAKNVDIGKIAQGLRSYFSQNQFFNFNEYDLWPIINDDLIQIIQENLIECMARINSFECMFSRLNPMLIIVDEDDCPFNRVLIRSANLKNIKSIQLIHGLTGNSLSESATISTKVAVSGNVAYNRLIEFGVEKNIIEIIGSPHYEQKLKHSNKNKIKKTICDKLRFLSDPVLVTLALQQFYSDDRVTLARFLEADFMEKMLRISIATSKKIKNIKLIIKLHPGEIHEWFVDDIIRSEKARHLVAVVKEYDIMDLLSASTLVLTSGSTVYTECLLTATPVLLFDDSRERSLDFLSTDYLDINNMHLSVRQIQNMIESCELRNDKLLFQKQELKTHFLNNNDGALYNFKQLVRNMSNRSYD